MDELPLQRMIPLQFIFADPKQPRKVFTEDALTELAQNITQLGLLQPLLVEQNNAERYTLICGERRWLAAKQAGLVNIPCIVYDTKHNPVLRQVMQYSENLFRENLTALDAIELVVDLHQQGVNTKDLALLLGKRHDWVQGHLLANTPPYRALFESGRLRSVSVLLLLRSLPERAQRTLITDTGLITSTRCQQLREHYKQLHSQRELPLLNTIISNEDRENINLPVRASITIPLNPQWLKGFVTKQALIREIQQVLDTHLHQAVQSA